MFFYIVFSTIYAHTDVIKSAGIKANALVENIRQASSKDFLESEAGKVERKRAIQESIQEEWSKIRPIFESKQEAFSVWLGKKQILF